MSTLSISPAFRPVRRPVTRAARIRVAPEPTVRLTHRGRVTFVLAFLAAAFVVMVAFGGWATATLGAGTSARVGGFEGQDGATLYGIAGRVAQPGKVREMVHQIQQLNSLSGAGL